MMFDLEQLAFFDLTYRSLCNFYELESEISSSFVTNI